MKRTRFNWRLFARHLREHRKSHSGCGVRDVAAYLRMSPATLSRAENGKALTVPVFLTLCDWMNSNPFQYHEDGFIRKIQR